MNESSLLAKVGLLVLSAALTFIIAWFWRYRATRDAERDKILTRLGDLDRQLAVVSTQVSPLWAAVQSKIAKDLTHPHPQFKQMDALLRKLEAMTITPDERTLLGELLEERIVSDDPAVNEDERDSATIMKIVMKKAEKELADSESG